MELALRTPIRVNGPRNRQKAQRRFTVLCRYSTTPEPSCVCCGEARLEFLTLDHTPRWKGAKLGGRGGSALIDFLIRRGFPSGFRVLCYNCNMSRGNYGYCPHERERVSNTTITEANSSVGADCAKAVGIAADVASVCCTPVAGTSRIGSADAL